MPENKIPLSVLHYFKRMGLYVCVNYTQHTHGTCSNSLQTARSAIPGQNVLKGTGWAGSAGSFKGSPEPAGRALQEATGSPMTLQHLRSGDNSTGQPPGTLFIRREFLRVLCRPCCVLFLFVFNRVF